MQQIRGELRFYLKELIIKADLIMKIQEFRNKNENIVQSKTRTKQVLH